jgi:shikimate kinase
MSEHSHNADKLILIGMPGSGKSTLGRALAKQLQLDFVDSDEEIVQRCGVDIATIFEVEGESGFRVREKNVIAELLTHNSFVLATGGGAILDAESRRRMSDGGTVIYLRARLDELVKRTTRDHGNRSNKRPLLQDGDVRERLTTLLAIRAPLYEAAAHITIDVDSPNRTRTLQRTLNAIASQRDQRVVYTSTAPVNDESPPTSE